MIRHFVNKKLKSENDGVVFIDKNKHLGSSQSHNKKNKIIWLDKNELKIKSQIISFPKKITTPQKFLILRLICIFLFKLKLLRELIKKLIV